MLFMKRLIAELPVYKMKYAISYEISDESEGSKHVRYYNALNKATAEQMFEATCEESLIGEDPHIVEIKKLSEEEDNT